MSNPSNKTNINNKTIIQCLRHQHVEPHRVRVCVCEEPYTSEGIRPITVNFAQRNGSVNHSRRVQVQNWLKGRGALYFFKFPTIIAPVSPLPPSLSVPSLQSDYTWYMAGRHHGALSLSLSPYS